MVIRNRLCASCKRTVKELYANKMVFMFNEDNGKLHYCRNNTICNAWPSLFESSAEFEEWLETETYGRMQETIQQTGNWRYE